MLPPPSPGLDFGSSDGFGFVRGLDLFALSSCGDSLSCTSCAVECFSRGNTSGKTEIDVRATDALLVASLRPLFFSDDAAIDALLIVPFDPLIFGFAVPWGVAYTDIGVHVGLDGCGEDVTASLFLSSGILDLGE